MILSPTINTMTPASIVDHLRTHMGEAILDAHPDDKHPRVHVDAQNWRALAERLFRDPSLSFDWLACLTGVDYVGTDELAVVYDFWSTALDHRFAVKVFCARTNPIVPTVCDLWKTANWHEREAYDLLGITFVGHPDMRRILCADDWVGHPLRKDYVFPQEYGGIPATPELTWQKKAPSLGSE